MSNNTIKKQKKVLEGTVVSNKMNKTIVVRVDNRIKHPLYGKTITHSKNFKAHDEKEQCKEGDTVRIIECRPISKDKSYRLVSILRNVVSLEEDDLDASVKEVLVKDKKEEPNVEEATSNDNVVAEEAAEATE